MAAELLAIIAPVFVISGIGFGWARSGGMFETAQITTLVTNLGAPSLIFSTLTSLEIAASEVGIMAVAAATALATFLALSAAILKLARLPVLNYLAPLSFPNIGNMGLPLCLFAFGEPGLALAIGVYAVIAVGQFTVGAWISSGDPSFRALLRTPIIYAVAAALAFLGTGTAPPAWLANTTRIIGGIAIPLMLLALGAALATLRITSLRRSLALSCLRLVMGLGVGLALAPLFGFEGTARGVLVIECAMPVAVFNYLFAERYGRAPGEVAGMVLLSTAISFATLPLLLLVVL